MSLIMRESVLGLFGHGGKGRPGVAVTYATTRGEIRPAGAVVTGLGCRVRYEIDVSDHRDEVWWTLPSRDERDFTARIGVGWRVSDPCEVTRRRVLDGLPVVLGYLHPVVRRLSRVLTAERRHDLEDQINELVLAGPARFAEGVEVYHLDAQVSSDEPRDERHLADPGAGPSQIDPPRRGAIARLARGDNRALLHHLTVHREDTMGVARLLMRQNRVSAQARTRLLEQFTDRLLPEELDDLAELLVRHSRDSVERPGTPVPWRPPVPAKALLPGA